MTRKSEGLSFPADPLAALRALQELDAPDAFLSGPTPPRPEAGAPARPAAPAAGTGGESATAAHGAKTISSRRDKVAPGGDSRGPTAASDPLGDAVRELLARPYADGAGRAPVTVSTVKIPTEVWERLGWVAAVTGRTKQDIIAEALKGYFRGVLRER